MFGNHLTYYHGTSTDQWEQIQRDGVFRPNDSKAVGGYWITKGAYFVCENPYVALWYAHLTCFRRKKGKPVVLAFDYKAGTDGDVINLLTSDGQAVLAHAYERFRDKVFSSLTLADENLDSVVLELLLSKSTMVRAVIAAFQEGTSYQRLHGGCYSNPYVTHQTGICPGDHAEICFVPDLSLDELGSIREVDDLELTNSGCWTSVLWPLVCRSLNSDWVDVDRSSKFTAHLAREYPEAGIS